MEVSGAAICVVCSETGQIHTSTASTDFQPPSTGREMDWLCLRYDGAAMKSDDVERRHHCASDSLVMRVVFITDNDLLTKGCSCAEIITVVQDQVRQEIVFDCGLSYCVQLNDGGGGGC